MSALYRELPAPDGLGALVSCVWEHEADEARGRRIDPDGCVDLIWLAEQELVVAGPDTSAQVARLQRLRASPDGSLAERALAAGYAHQAHMNDEVRRLTGTTAVRFLEDAARNRI